MSKTRKSFRKPAGENQTLLEQAQKLLNQKGRHAFHLIRNAILEETIKSENARRALAYFAENWHDTSRPALLSLVCESIGGNPEATTPFGVALSLISGGYDLHDDIIDGSVAKGGKPTVLGKFGRDTALLVGDALMLKGFTLLNKSCSSLPQHKSSLIRDIVQNMFLELFDAEMLEIQFRRRLDVKPTEYLDIVRKKAGDVEAHTRTAALIGDASDHEIEALGKYGRALGMLIILRDDVIDAYDLDEAKQRYTNEHLPLPVVYALQKKRGRASMDKMFLKKHLTKKDAAEVLSLTKTKRGFADTENVMHTLLRDAKDSIATIGRRDSLYLLADSVAHISLNQIDEDSRSPTRTI